MYGDPHESLIDVERVELDPLYGGFSGVVVELLREGAFSEGRLTREGARQSSEDPRMARWNRPR
ncbi:hypothetical protein GBA63_12115 [Rubrobacter tropicus]|uniref:Uncharacterized protein n=1 Tax=Rubrobacter tropicus TaxID=2653851 RepID=A0A6G8QA47_9ACTN|nr:hypothetical protein [Rubrobacter tropicus]QIN83298.1 hypothetical protein GBA63_12115 [Rubrobacter tropicus]